MHKTVGMLAVALALMIALPCVSTAGEDNPHKYGIEFQLGGGYLAMTDVNDFTTSAFSSVGADPDKINIGTQFGLGIIYRHMDDFGWQFGYNKLVAGVPVALEQKYRVEAYFTATQSWAEQTISGSEFYALATWYKPFKAGELMLGIGPAVYSATLDRSIDIVQSEGSHLTSGSFSDANGKGLGLLFSLGYEMPLGDMTGLTFQLGGRMADVGNLEYEDSQGVDQTVMLNPASNAKLSVDFSGIFLKISLRTYFKPSSDWRNPAK